METKVMYSDRVKLDESNWNATEGSYKWEATFKDGEKLIFDYIPGEHTTYTGNIAVGKLIIPDREYPVEVKEREGKAGKFLSGCLNYDEKRFANLKKQPSSWEVEVYTISFSKPEEATEATPKVEDEDTTF